MGVLEMCLVSLYRFDDCLHLWEKQWRDTTGERRETLISLALPVIIIMVITMWLSNVQLHYRLTVYDPAMSPASWLGPGPWRHYFMVWKWICNSCAISCQTRKILVLNKHSVKKVQARHCLISYWEQQHLLQRAHIHTHIHTFIHTYVHTYTHTYIQTCATVSSDVDQNRQNAPSFSATGKLHLIVFL